MGCVGGEGWGCVNLNHPGLQLIVCDDVIAVALTVVLVLVYHLVPQPLATAR